MALLLSVQYSFAQTRTWTGATSTDWFTTSNWSGGNVPGPGDNVVIQAATYAPAFNTTLSINNLTIGNWSSTAPLNINGGLLTVTGEITLTAGGLLQLAGGTLNHTGSSFSFSYGTNVGVNISSGLLTTNATNFQVNSSMTMSGGEFIANNGLTIATGKIFTQSAGKIRINGHLNISSSGTQFTLGSDSLIVNGRITLNTSANLYGGNSIIIINRQSGQNNQISGNWYTQQANVTFNPSNPMGTNLTSISSSGAVFYANQGTVLFNDSVFIGSNANLNADSGVVTFSRSLQVSSAGTVNNNSGTLNFNGNATFTSSGTLNAGGGALNFGGDVVVDNSNGVINAGEATIVVQGDMTNTGTFNAGTSTVIFDGDSDQVISNDIVFYNLIIETTGSLTAGGNVTVLNDGVIGDSTEIVLDDNQLNVQGELTDNGGNLAVATDKPFVVSATTPTNLQIRLVFNEALNATANTAGNYSISPARTISSAVRTDSIVLLTVTAVLDPAVEYTVTMNNIENLANVPVNPNHIKRITASFAVSPSVQASAILIDQPDTNKIRVKISRGNGARVLVLAKSASAVNASPVNGTGYTANANFGSGNQIGSGNYVVYAGTDSVFTMTGLAANTIYHLRAYEYNGTAAGSQYNLSGMPVANRSTLLAPPTQQASIVSKTAITTTTMTLTFAAGNGNRRLVVLRANSAVDTSPVAGTFYTANANFASAGEISTGNKVVYYSTATSVNITGLSPGTRYYLKLYEANGSASGNDNYYLTGAPVDSFMTAATEPAVVASVPNFILVDTSRLTLRVNKGDGAYRLVVMRRASAVAVSPVDGRAYTASTTFGAGDTLNAETFVVYSGSDSVFPVNGLEPGISYHYRVFEFNGSQESANYRTTTYLTSSRTTLDSLPTAQAVFTSVSSITSSGFQLNFAAGSGGNRRLVVIKAGSAVDVEPAQGLSYTANAVFGSGTNLGNSNFVVYASTGTSVSVTGLNASQQYYYRIYEYGYTTNGSEHYLLTNPVAGNIITRAITPTVQASNLVVTAFDSTQISLSFQKGNGSRHLVVIRQASAVAFTPTNGITYNGSTVYAAGDSVGALTYILHTGTDSQMTITGLSPGVSYHFRVSTYNGLGDSAAYNTTSAPIVNRTTLSLEPTLQAIIGAFSNRSASGFRVNWTPGNGTHRLVLLRANGPITVDPVDGVNYTASATFGNGSLLGDSTYVVYLGTSLTQTGTLGGMSSATTYYAKVYEVSIGATGSNNYLLLNASSGSTSTLTTAPSVSATDLVVTAISATSIRLSWTKGNGERSLVVGRQNANVTAPTSGVGYSADSNWTQGSVISGSSYVVYADTGNSVIITGLTANTNYRFRVYPYNGQGLAATYRTTSPAAISRNTLPATLSSSPVFDQIGPNGFRMSWQGGGTGKIVVMRKAAPVSIYPPQGANYVANAAFGSGTDLGDSNFVVYSSTANQVTITNLEQNTTYYLAVFDYSGTATTRSYAFTPAIDSSQFTHLRLDIKVFLQGPFIADTLSANILADIPLSQPYNTSPWNYAGSETVGAVPALPIVDWVYIQTRRSTSAGAAVSDSITAEAVAWLRSDGKIVALNGTDYVTMPISRPGNQYVVIFHRTHIPIMSNSPVYFDTDAYRFDFTSAQNQAFGSDPQQLLSGGVWGMYSGRVEQTTPYLIDLADIQQVWIDKNTEGGYADADAVLEGLVDATDRSVVWNNRNRSSQVPE